MSPIVDKAVRFTTAETIVAQHVDGVPMVGSNSNTQQRADGPGMRWREVENLCRDHADWLRSLLTRRLRVQPAEVEDIMQETWLRVAGPPVPEIRHPKAFLSQTALNLFRDRRRRETVRGDHRAATILAHGDGPVGAEPVAEQEINLLIEQTMLGLPELYRDAFILSRVGHLSHKAIAERLGISQKAVEWRIAKAVELCAAALRS